MEEDFIFFRELHGTADKNAAGLVNQRVRLAHPHQILDLLVQFLEVAGRVVIENDEINDQAFQPPIRMGQEQLAHERELLRLGDAHQHNRMVPGNAMPPKSGLALMVGRQGTVRPQRRARIENVGRQPLVEVCFAGRQAEMLQLYLTVGPGQLKRPVHAMKIMVLVSQSQGVFARLRYAGRKRYVDRGARVDAQTLP